MINFKVGEEVLYESQFDFNWRKGVISRISEDGFSPVAIIWEKTEKYEFANKILMKNIRKICK